MNEALHHFAVENSSFRVTTASSTGCPSPAAAVVPATTGSFRGGPLPGCRSRSLTPLRQHRRSRAGKVSLISAVKRSTWRN